LQAGNVSDGFAQKVRRILQIRAKGRVQYGTKTGSLHAGNLFRLRVDGASHEYQQRIFKKRIVSDVLDSAVSVLVDTSGSMSGEKYACAITAAVHLSGTIGNTLHIPTEIIGFTEVEYRNTMFIHRTFDKKLLSKEALTSSLTKASSWMNQNCDGDSVLFAASRLLQRKEKRKLLIVLSDGSPASSKPGDVMGYTMDIVRQLDSVPALDIVGIGIQDDNVTRIYKQHHVIHEAHEIESALLSIIERKLI
jgi:cobalamin biosynthesis protein CobT